MKRVFLTGAIIGSFLFGFLFRSVKASEQWEKPLAFFAAMCHEEEGFAFDGFTLSDSYELFEKRLSATKHTDKLNIEKSESDDGQSILVTISGIRLEEYPGAVGSVWYQFENGQFYQGELQVEFSSYRAAKDYIAERMEAVSAYRDTDYLKRQEEEGITDGGWWTWETGKDGAALEGLYVDSNHSYLSFEAKESEDYRGHAVIRYGENSHADTSEFLVKPEENEESFEELYESADSIYRVKINGMNRINPFVQNCEGELLEKIRVRYKVKTRSFREPCSNLLAPIDTALGEEFFLLERYDKETKELEKMVLYQVNSEEGKSIQAQIDAGNEEVVTAPVPQEGDPVEDGKRRAGAIRAGSIVDNYFADNGWENPEGTCYGLGYLEFGETYTNVIKIKKGYPEVCEGLRAVLPEDDSWRIEECDLNYRELESIQERFSETYKGMLSVTSISAKDCAVHVYFDLKYADVLLPLYFSLLEEDAPYIRLRGVSRATTAPGMEPGEEVEEYIPRAWFERTCGFQLHR